MPIDYGSETGEYVKLPKVGEPPKEFHIKTAEKVEDPNYKYNFMLKKPVKDKNGDDVLDANGKQIIADENQGFRYVFTCMDDKKFSISSWKPFYAFKEQDVQDGDLIRVSHPDKGEWKVEVLKKGVSKESKEDEINWDE